eukprot:CAMPEP_0178402948 /NCGR_PEP_ID=MMETSP0689_2-20121128/17115_1 /TAXON_ID=160604 /ORGANISM="Amphidinium massartii, Strain CS-259" /LENGTH=666 /DNA_ID=CAMNT_0020023885 /DNA_START=19 /DNA_END=2019 /DNA_ORIENTATION=-
MAFPISPASCSVASSSSTSGCPSVTRKQPRLQAVAEHHALVGPWKASALVAVSVVLTHRVNQKFRRRGHSKYAFVEVQHLGASWRHGARCHTALRAEHEQFSWEIQKAAPKTVVEEAPNLENDGLNTETECDKLLPGLPEESRVALFQADIAEPSAIQALVWPRLWGRTRENVVLQAPTGSGKTLAFLLPVLKHLREAQEEDMALPGPERRSPMLLIIAPTRELAVQLRTEVEIHGKSLSVALVVLGVQTSWDTLEVADVVVATPRELCWYLDTKDEKYVGWWLNRVIAVVADELDALIPMGPHKMRRRRFKYQDSDKWPCEAMLKRLLMFNDYPDLQILAASATPWKATRKKLIAQLDADPLERFTYGKGRFLKVHTYKSGNKDPNAASHLRHSSGYAALPEGITHFSQEVKYGSSHAREVLNVLEKLRPRSALVFVCPNAGEKVEDVVRMLRDEGGWRNTATLAKQLFADSRYSKAKEDRRWAAKYGPSPEERAVRCTKELLMLRAKTSIGWEGAGFGSYKDAPILVSAEESSRGMHLDGAQAVVIVGLPNTGASYLHMAGRTGRLPFLKGAACLVAWPEETKKVKFHFAKETGLHARTAWKNLRKTSPWVAQQSFDGNDGIPHDQVPKDQPEQPEQQRVQPQLDTMLGSSPASLLLRGDDSDL